MKLRLKGNSVRLRLGRSELSELLKSGLIEDSTAFGGLARQRFVYTLSATPSDGAVSASFDEGCVDVRVSHDMLRRWASTDELSISGSQPSGDGGTLRILIEKDLECVNPAAGESQEDAFPHPPVGTLCSGGNGPEVTRP